MSSIVLIAVMPVAVAVLVPVSVVQIAVLIMIALLSAIPSILAFLLCLVILLYLKRNVSIFYLSKQFP